MSEKEMQTKMDDALLKSINKLGSKFTEKLYFNDFFDSYENNNSIKFVKSYFKEIKKMPQQLIDDMNGIEDFDSLIEFLSKLEPNFKVLVFNFSKDEFKKSSSILFYTNFLNSFFIDRTREEFYERCSTILSTKEPMIDLLTNWQTYLSIASFIVNTKTHFEAPIQFDQNAFIYQKKFPKLIDSNFLNECKENKKLPDAIFYQLQFMFNMIDQSSEQLEEKNGVNEPEKTEIQQDTISNNALENKMNKSPDATIINQIDDDFCINSFNRKIKKNTYKNESLEKLWNQTDKNYSFENGILYDNSKFKKRKEESIEEWEYGIVSIIHKHLSKSKIITFQFEQQNQQQSEGKLYKLFCYNENENKWEKRVNDFSKFFEDKKKFISKGKLTPLIFLYNSKEEDLIAINSNFIKTKYPAIEEEEEIFIYGLCDESMYDICKGLDNQESYKNIIPIILLLHVPKSKENLPNLKTIILQISTFISSISDINIIVLDKEHYEDQIDMLNEINNIKLSYNESIEHLSNHQHFVNGISDKSMKPLDNNDILSKLNENVFSKNSKHIILFNEPIFKYTNRIIESLFNSDFITTIFDKIIKNRPITYTHHFINVNDSTTYKGFIQIFSESVLNIKSQSKSQEILQNFIDMQLTKMTPLYCQLKSQVNIDVIKKILQIQKAQKSINLMHDLYQIKQLNDKLKDIKSDINMYNQLIEIIQKMFLYFEEEEQEEEMQEEEEGESNNNKNRDLFKSLLKVQEEFYSKCPPLDNIFYDITTLAIEDFRNQLCEMNNIRKLIERYADYDFDRLHHAIIKRSNWSDEEINDIKLSHSQFLKEKFLNIIQKLYPNDASSVYFINSRLLKETNDNSNMAFDDVFKTMKNENEPKIVRICSEIKKRIRQGTNYHIRETEAENETELKLILKDKDKLDDIIDNDFY